MKIWFASFVCLLLFVTGCENTISGFGKDMQKTGQQIQKSVNS